MDIQRELQAVFRTIFDDDSLTIGRETTARDIEGWDSLMHVNLVVAIEKRFGVSFALGELEDLKNVGDMLDLIARKLA